MPGGRCQKAIPSQTSGSHRGCAIASPTPVTAGSATSSTSTSTPSASGANHLGRRLADYANELRRRAVRLAEQEASQRRLLEVLRKVRPVDGVGPLADERLLALAAGGTSQLPRSR